MKMMSYNVSRSHNVNTYDYVKTEAPILREMVGHEEFTREEYERKSSFWNEGLLCHRGLSLDAARRWGFVEVVRQEPRFVKEEFVMVTSHGHRVCSAEEYRKMDETVIATIETVWGKLQSKKMLSPYSDQYINIYRWNDENYHEWLNKGRLMINGRTRCEIQTLMERIETLKGELI